MTYIADEMMDALNAVAVLKAYSCLIAIHRPTARFQVIRLLPLRQTHAESQASHLQGKI